MIEERRRRAKVQKDELWKRGNGKMLRVSGEEKIKVGGK